MPWEDSDLPHGVVHHHFYKSAIVGDNRDLYVYTPPGYDPANAAKYPVLYLLHGYSDDASAWTAVGRANLILDSLIAAQKAKPMIIVMPLGYGDPTILHPAGSNPPFQDPALRRRNVTQFVSALIEEVIPQVERSYKVDSGRDSRAIAGLSMGGAESLVTGLNHLDRFSWVASFSAGGLDPNFAEDFPQLNAATSNAQLHALWIACGTDDHLIKLNRDLVSWLKTRQLRVTPIETPGMHAWMVWRRNLIALAPLLFSGQADAAAAAGQH